MKKDALMQEFENLKIENSNQVFGGEQPSDQTVCDQPTQYETLLGNNQKKTDTKTDRATDDWVAQNNLLSVQDNTFCSNVNGGANPCGGL